GLHCWSTRLDWRRGDRPLPDNPKRRADPLENRLLAPALEPFRDLAGPGLSKRRKARYALPAVPFESDGGVGGDPDGLSVGFAWVPPPALPGGHEPSGGRAHGVPRRRVARRAAPLRTPAGSGWPGRFGSSPTRS